MWKIGSGLETTIHASTYVHMSNMYADAHPSTVHATIHMYVCVHMYADAHPSTVHATIHMYVCVHMDADKQED